MDRTEALRQIEALLAREGRADLASELRSVAAAAEAAETYAKTITEVTRAMLENEKTYRLVFENEADPMSLFEVGTGRFLEVNAAWVKLYGYTREEALTMKVTAVSAEPAETERACAALPPGDMLRVPVRWHRSKDGTVFPVELSSGKLTLGERPVAWAVMRDITQRENTKHLLERSESRFRALIESMPDGVLVHRLGVVVYMSPSLRRLLGFDADERVEGIRVLDLVQPEHRETVIERWKQMVATGGPAPPLEAPLLRKDGSAVVAEVVAHNIVYDGGPALLAIARDSTARKQVEAQLVMNDRLASLGRLSASIGHELNNPLAYVLGNLELLSREIARVPTLDDETSERLYQHLTIIREGAARMRDIVRDLKTLARGDVERTSPVELQSILDVCISMAEREIIPRARVVRELGARAFVAGSEARFGQVFLNLLLNAAQSIPEGEPERNEVRVVARWLEEGRVAVEIVDTGAGIPPEHLERIFEPFFTTKHGDGTGLGLSICHRIVTSAGGTLTAHPNEGRGSTFRVVLPTVEAS